MNKSGKSGGLIMSSAAVLTVVKVSGVTEMHFDDYSLQGRAIWPFLGSKCSLFLGASFLQIKSDNWLHQSKFKLRKTDNNRIFKNRFCTEIFKFFFEFRTEIRLRIHNRVQKWCDRTPQEHRVFYVSLLYFSSFLFTIYCY